MSIITLDAPIRLGVSPAELDDTLGYLARIRAMVHASKDTVVLNLGPSVHISPAARLMLCAELDVCHSVAAGRVTCTGPDDPLVRRRLSTAGFDSRLGFPLTGIASPPSTEFVIRTGDSLEDGSAALELAEVVTRLSADVLPSMMSNVMLGALQEAIINITDHAYRGAPVIDRLPGQWWYAGSRQRNGMTFVAYDHGVGIPRRALEDWHPEIDQYWQKKKIPASPASEKQILEAALQARRSGIDLGGNGLGLPFMIDLLDRPHVRGRFFVVSGSAVARFTRTSEARCVLNTSNAGSSLCGTLFAWQVSTAK